jgi:hypothetical protein
MFSREINYNYSKEILTYVDKIEAAISQSSVIDFFNRNNLSLFLYCKEIASYCRSLERKGDNIILDTTQLDNILCDVCKSEIIADLDKDSINITHINEDGRLVYTLNTDATIILTQKFNKMTATE